MIFVDSHIPMYLVGAAHPNKELARRLLEQSISAGERLVTDAEVLQEILHRYHAIRRPDAIQAAFDALLGVADEVFPIEHQDVEQAKALMLGMRGLSARDAVHAAVMRRREIDTVMSFHTGFDRIAGLERRG
ncbi:MAG: type II toxin-antitoxin system VapC family toxin [Gemmatimonadales bacterium]